MPVYLRDPKSGSTAPFSSTTAVDYQMFVKSGWQPTAAPSAPATAPTSLTPNTPGPWTPPPPPPGFTSVPISQQFSEGDYDVIRTQTYNPTTGEAKSRS